MKNNLFLFLLLVTFFSTAQNPLFKIIGEWKLEATDFKGTIYPTNSWNEEYLFLSDDYTFIHRVNSYVDKEILTKTIEGKWFLSKDSTRLILNNDFNRYQKDLSIKTIYKEFDLELLTSSYIVVNDISKKQAVLKRYRSSQATETFDESVKRYEQLLIDRTKVLDQNVYQFIAGGDTILKNYKNANVILSSTTGSYEGRFRQKNTYYDGKIVKLTDSTIFLKPHLTYRRSYTKDFVLERRFEHYKNSNLLEIPMSNVNKIHLPISTIGMKSSFYFSAASAVTALIVAPIVSMLSPNDQRVTNYLYTAGAGIIGVGIGTGCYYLFKNLERPFGKTKNAKSVEIAPKYHYKK